MLNAEELRKALHDAATSLETISLLAGRKSYGDPPIKTYMDTFMDVRLYAAARAKVAREALDAAGVSAPTQTDEIGVAIALEQQRALKIVDDVHNLRIGGRNEKMPTAFHAGYCLACEEIEHRLRTEQWALCGQPAPLPSSEVAASSSTAASGVSAVHGQTFSPRGTDDSHAAKPAAGQEDGK